MPELPCPGQEVRWWNPEQARAWGWEAAFGPGPFVVARLVDHRRHRLATGLVLHTALGEQEISEVWLALADKAGAASGGPVPQSHSRRGNAAPSQAMPGGGASASRSGRRRPRAALPE
jgi:hypothetical protein